MGPLISSQVGALVASTHTALCSTSMKYLKESHRNDCQKTQIEVNDQQRQGNKWASDISEQVWGEETYFRQTEWISFKKIMSLNKNLTLSDTTVIKLLFISLLFLIYQSISPQANKVLSFASSGLHHSDTMLFHSYTCVNGRGVPCQSHFYC